MPAKRSSLTRCSIASAVICFSKVLSIHILLAVEIALIVSAITIRTNAYREQASKSNGMKILIAQCQAQ